MPTATIIDGTAIARRMLDHVARDVAEWTQGGGGRPGLATILVGDDPASEVYVEAKHRACADVGIRSFRHRLPADVRAELVRDLIDRLDDDPQVSGILLQLPLPAGLDAAALVERIDAHKDVDGLTTHNAGLLWRRRPGLVPCTPLGILAMLHAVHGELRGLEVTIVGESELVGRPLAGLLLAREATVTVCHRHSPDVLSACRRADVIVAACGVPELIDAAHVRPGATVIDVGITRTERGLVGDVDFASAAGVAAAITPVPGGVGPMTIACLMANTMRAARLQALGQSRASAAIS